MFNISNASYFGHALNSSVTKTRDIREMQLMFGYLAIILSCAIWTSFANVRSLPISTTQSIVGGIVGYALILMYGRGIQWHTIKYITASWIVTPFVSGLISVGFYIFCKSLKVRKMVNKTSRCSTILDYSIYFIVLYFVSFSITVNDPFGNVFDHRIF
ncbi:Sodium-dependent phosphate transporter 2 [Thelohanellus kitauei]|uniref:Sodium-dependent phosphate transporter 2 n=1 Tax=Thelohanellus kitauei TaxID=669202 RepID=A0A0C2MCY0_THEKT|nr:Sodium-dependent phosphate transporter 2 [Thelohanellus kitauei]